MGSWRRLRLRGALFVVVAVGLSVPVPAYGGPAWTIDRTPSDGGFSQLTAVSCVSVRWCAAVGYASGLPRFDVIAEIWDGSGWTLSSIPVDEYGRLVDVSCVSASWCAAVGWKPMGADGTASFVVVWDGHSWREVPSPDPGSLNNLLYGVSCVSRSSCLAVGTFGANSFHLLTERWDGRAWRVVTVPAVDRVGLTAVSCLATNACVAVGSSTSSAVALRWNGHTWSSHAMPTRGPSRDNMLADLSCTSTTACVAVGASGPGVPGYTNDPHERTLVETWNGKRWVIVPSPNRFDYVSVLNGVSCVSARACTAVGHDLKMQGGQTRTLIEAWDGRSWRLVSSPNRPTGTSDGYLEMHGSELRGVSCLPAACTAAGLYQDTRHTATVQTLVEARR